jgi:hypothetical protein
MKQAKNKAPAKPARSLSQFMRDRKKKDCKVCALGTEIVAQIRTASRNKIPRETVLAWLREECNAGITSADLQAHANGRHDLGDE